MTAKYTVMAVDYTSEAVGEEPLKEKREEVVDIISIQIADMDHITLTL